MQLLGHKDIHMTLRYVEVTQLDLHREFYTARQRAAQTCQRSRKNGVSRTPAGIAPGSSPQARPSVNGQALLEMV
jgi:hypothetical protein